MNRKTLLTALLALLTLTAFAQPGETQMRQRLAGYMQCYPEAQLRDVYKYCFQDIYGPGHLVIDSAICAQSILGELERVDTADHAFPDYEPCGIEGHYVRVNLRLVKNGTIPLGEFVSLLMRSARVEHPMPLDEWRGQWQTLLTLLRTIQPQPHNFEADAAEIQQLLDSGKYAAHHSARFNAAYHPHYRILRADLIEQ